MIKILFLFVCVSLSLSARPISRIASEIEEGILSDTKDMNYLKKVMDRGMNRAIERANHELKIRGEFALADEVMRDWENVYGRSMFSMTRDIGDHKGLSQWVEDKYYKIELILGRDLCVSTHIAAMLTFNNGIPVVFHPCQFPMDSVTGERSEEYKRHFAGKSMVSDSKYNGVVPEAVYFTIEIACLFGSAGGGSLICSLAAAGGEKLMATFVAPRLSDRIFNRKCSAKDIGDY